MAVVALNCYLGLNTRKPGFDAYTHRRGRPACTDQLLDYDFPSLESLIQAFKWALLFLLFPTFLICSYFSLLFHENALLSLLFHSKMPFTRKNPEIFPRSLRSLGFYNLMFIQGARRLTLKFFMFNLKVSLFG